MSKSKQDAAGEIRNSIHTIRGQRVLLDEDLARFYGVPVKRLNEQLRRNRQKFPADFAFQLNKKEWAALRSQTVILKDSAALRSQNATLKGGRGRHRKYAPVAFTEYGALQAANVLSSPRATAMSVFVIRAFIKLREDVATNAAILKRLAEIDKTLLTHDSALRDIYRKLLPLLAPPPEPKRREIGFHTEPEPPTQ
ncbi:MAG: ORF6N domain-containing protein [Verrucomicrobiota bacterium]